MFYLHYSALMSSLMTKINSTDAYTLKYNKDNSAIQKFLGVPVLQAGGIRSVHVPVNYPD